LREEEVKGVAARKFKATERSPLKRVGAKQAAARAEQAALGVVGRPPSAFDEAELQKWIGGLQPEQWQKLNKLVWAARSEKQPSNFEKSLDRRGVNFEIHGGSVTINLETSQGGSWQKKDWNKEFEKSDWGRSMARLRDFVKGH